MEACGINTRSWKVATLQLSCVVYSEIVMS